MWEEEEAIKNVVGQKKRECTYVIINYSKQYGMNLYEMLFCTSAKSFRIWRTSVFKNGLIANIKRPVQLVVVVLSTCHYATMDLSDAL